MFFLLPCFSFILGFCTALGMSGAPGSQVVGRKVGLEVAIKRAKGFYHMEIIK